MPRHSGTFAVLSAAAATSCELRVDPADCGRLLELLALVPDPRKPRGIRHSVVAVLAVAAAAVLAGSKSVLAVGSGRPRPRTWCWGRWGLGATRRGRCQMVCVWRLRLS